MCICRLTKRLITLVCLLVVLLIVAGIIFAYYTIKHIKNNEIFPFVVSSHTYEVVNKYRHVHDPTVGKEIKIEPLTRKENEKIYPFTQGFFFSNKNKLIESSGLYGSSLLREFDLSTSTTLRYINLPPRYFGEGCSLIIEPSTLRKYILQLTYKEKQIFVIDYETFELYHTFVLDLDGYGLTSNVDALQSLDNVRDSNFILSQRLWTTSGDEYLYELNIPESFKKVNRLTVLKKTKITCGGFLIDRANELEYHTFSNTIFANIFLTSLIIEINAETGACVKLIDLEGLIKKCDNSGDINEYEEDVLNGLAISPESRMKETPNLLVTGKNWSNIFEIKIIEQLNGMAYKLLVKEKFKLDV